MAAPDVNTQDGGLWVAVPFKGPVGSKRRLAGLLDEAERARLSLAMLDGVLEAALGAASVARVLLMLPAGVQPPDHQDARLTVVTESPTDSSLGAEGAGVDGLNRALVQAQAVANGGGAASLLILPSDLPLISSEDVEALIGAARIASVVISPDRAAEGTNSLLLQPPLALEPAFGVASFSRHQRLAEQAGLTVAVVKRWGLALDLDTPADVLRLFAIGRECRAAGLLQELDVASRLARLTETQGAPSSA